MKEHIWRIWSTDWFYEPRREIERLVSFLEERQRKSKAEPAPSYDESLFDFEKQIYGDKIKVSFLTRLRDDKKFATKQELIEQINKDKENSLKYLGIKIKS